MPNYFTQAQPYDSGTVPDISGALAKRFAMQSENRRLSLAEMASQRDERRLGMEEKLQGPKLREKLMALDTKGLEHVKNVNDFTASMVSQVEWDGTGQDYQGFRNHMLQELPKMGIPPEKVASELPERVSSQEEFEAIKKKIINKSMDVKEQVDYAIKQKQLEEPEKEDWGTPKEGVDENGKPIVYVTNKKGEVKVIKGVGPSPKKGMKVYDKDGNLILDTSGGATGDMTPKTKGAVEEKQLGGKEQLVRMKAIASEFKPEFQEIGTRLGAAWTGVKAKLGQDVPEEDKKQLVEFKRFQRKSIENINLYIKEMTGAQMSEKEADRLRLAQPDPGEKWWQGDDPITFKAKMDDVIKGARAAVARYDYYRSKGLSDSEIKGLVGSDQAISLESIMAQMV